MTTTLTVPSHPDRPGYPLAPTPLYSVHGYDEDRDEWTIEVATPTALDRLAALPAAQADAIAHLALGIASQAGDLWAALVAIPDEDPVRPAIEVVTTHALTAGLALLNQPQEPKP